MLTTSEVQALIRSEANRAGGVRALAREWGCDPAYISDLCNGKREPGPKILGPLGLEKLTVYVPAGDGR